MSSERRRSYSKNESTTCVFDLFFDIPHPAATPITSERAKIIEPPGRIHPDISELYHPNNISKIPKFAFPDYDERKDHVPKVGGESATSAILNKFHLSCFSSRLVHHTFALQLESGTRIYAHVLRYLPTHPDVKTRYDVGRRCERAMILFTRAVGGVKFYSSLLRTLQAIHMEEMSLPPVYMGHHDFIKAFLHSVYKRHLLLKKTYHDKVLNDEFKIVHKVLREEYTKVTISGAELFFLLPSQSSEARSKLYDHGDAIGNLDGLFYFKDHDFIAYQLPLSLQPGYNPKNFYYECGDLHSPILPLLRCLGPSKAMRVLSALLCEHRIVFVSKSIEILSTCVSACTAMLAQGSLVWRHVQIPVLPPHLLPYLTADSPFIVGVLEKYCESVESLPGFKGAIYIDLDQGLLSTLYMQDATTRVPDLLLRKGRRNGSAVNELANDFTLILQEEKEVWESIDLSIEDETKEIKKESLNKRKGISAYFGFYSKEEKAQTAVQNFVPKLSDTTDHTFDESVYVDRDKAIDVMHLGDESNKRFCAYTLSSNEKGEEAARASLVCLFLEIFGDMGMYLTVDNTYQKGTSSFFVDTNKFLNRKRQMGIRQDTPMYSLLEQLTQTKMFEAFAKSRIADLEKKESSKSENRVLINHTTLFNLCQNHMSSQRAKFVTENIRDIVFTTVSSSPERILIDTLEDVRETALALTSETPFEGDEVAALTSLINVCKGCCQSYMQVMQVVWLRIREHRSHLWKRPLLGLHLLRNFILHGPIATLSSSIVELGRIRGLMDYKSKSEEHAVKVQTAARQVYVLLKNLCRLFLRRRKVMTLKVNNSEHVSENMRWSGYLIRRLPGSVHFHQIHELMRPPDGALPRRNNYNGVEEDQRNHIPADRYMNNRDINGDVRDIRDTRRLLVPPEKMLLDAEFDGSKRIGVKTHLNSGASVESRNRDMNGVMGGIRIERRPTIPPEQMLLDAEFDGSKRIGVKPHLNSGASVESRNREMNGDTRGRDIRRSPIPHQQMLSDAEIDNGKYTSVDSKRSYVLENDSRHRYEVEHQEGMKGERRVSLPPNNTLQGKPRSRVSKSLHDTSSKNFRRTTRSTAEESLASKSHMSSKAYTSNGARSHFRGSIGNTEQFREVPIKASRNDRRKTEQFREVPMKENILLKYDGKMDLEEVKL